MLTNSVQLLQTKTTLQNFSPKLLSTSQTPFSKAHLLQKEEGNAYNLLLFLLKLHSFLLLLNFFKSSSTKRRNFFVDINAVNVKTRNFSLMRNNFKIRGPTSTKKQLVEPR
jgi:hypothetical protein